MILNFYIKIIRISPLLHILLLAFCIFCHIDYITNPDFCLDSAGNNTPITNNSVEFNGYYGDANNSGPNFLLERDTYHNNTYNDWQLYDSNNNSLRTSAVSPRNGINPIEVNETINSSDSSSIDKWSMKNHVSSDATSYKGISEQPINHNTPSNSTVELGEIRTRGNSHNTLLGEIPNHRLAGNNVETANSSRLFLNKLSLRRQAVLNGMANKIDEHEIHKEGLNGSVHVGFKYELSKLQEVYIKYENITRRKFFWKIWEKHTDNYSSYEQFKSVGWDSDISIYQTIKVNLKQEVKQLLDIKDPFNKSLLNRQTRYIFKKD